MFPNIPIESAVAVQCEDGSPWTHGMVIGKGNLYHHGRSYGIQLTNNGKPIARNRHHIKLTIITARHISTAPI